MSRMMVRGGGGKKDNNSDNSIYEEISKIKTDNVNELVRDFSVEDKLMLYKKIKINQIIEKAIEKNKSKKIKKETTNNYHKNGFSTIYLVETNINDKTNENLEIDIELVKFLNENKIPEILENIKLEEIFYKSDIDDILKMNMNEEKQIQFGLSQKEKDNIRTQLSNCYKKAILKTKKNNRVKVVVNLPMLIDGTIDLEKVVFSNKTDDDKDYDEASQNVMVTLVFCNPLSNLPQLKYDIWKNTTFTFDVGDILY